MSSQEEKIFEKIIHHTSHQSPWGGPFWKARRGTSGGGGLSRIARQMQQGCNTSALHYIVQLLDVLYLALLTSYLLYLSILTSDTVTLTIHMCDRLHTLSTGHATGASHL